MLHHSTSFATTPEWQGQPLCEFEIVVITHFFTRAISCWDFLLLIDVNEWINNECIRSECVKWNRIHYLNINNGIACSLQEFQTAMFFIWEIYTEPGNSYIAQPLYVVTT
jgi:hypothetical protein